MGAQLIERALAEWRDGERLLRELPPNDRDHDTVRRAVIDLRDTYKDLAQLPSNAIDQLADYERRIDAAHDTLTEVRTRSENAA